MVQMLHYHSWNADGITKEKITKMMHHWKDSDLIFIQETKLPAKDERMIADFLKQQYGYDSIFHPSIQWKSDPSKWGYGVCVFYKHVRVQLRMLRSSNPNLPLDPERLMMVKVNCDLLDKEILFFNIYFPAQNTSRISRSAEQQKWLTTINVLCRQHADEHCIWLGDFNMQKLKPGKQADIRSKLFGQLQKIIKKHGFRNVADKLWQPNVFTRHAPHDSNKVNHITSTLDYVITSKSIQELNQTCVPLYDMDLSLSDHINIKCSNKIATLLDFSMPFLKRVVLSPPTIVRKDFVELKCNRCGYKPTAGKAAQGNLRKHDAKCTGPKETVCPDCNIEYGNPGNLARHIQMGLCAASAYETICSDCGMDFNSFHNLKIHRGMKTCCKDRNPVPVCLKCNKNYGNMGALATHKKYGC
ncbi:Zinc finger and BTB domain-containing protein 49 [Folsomia candida]|uniref:Zinc finger and BTB domain-containing protein 49 n=1 Tax=Folsomia candida TaxID=158441 RepID=A0A226D004_FOLCA|nr:Zinc finger and BTB domain-containing protein 49 [Folsomia candida]